MNDSAHRFVSGGARAGWVVALGVAVFGYMRTQIVAIAELRAEVTATSAEVRTSIGRSDREDDVQNMRIAEVERFCRAKHE